jgi:hypothetical protein
VQSLNCPNCGAGLQIENQFIRTVTCRFCGSAFLVRGSEGLDPTGKSANLGDFPSMLSVGATGKIRGRGFKVLGRVRYAYDAGFWEEWQIAWDDNAPPDWLEEDEGLWTVYRRERVKQAIPPYEQVRVGGIVPVNNYKVFVTEKRTGKVAGSEGQFSSVLPMKGTFGYFQGSADNKTVSINYWEDEIELSVGDDLEQSDLTVG